MLMVLKSAVKPDASAMAPRFQFTGALHSPPLTVLVQVPVAAEAANGTRTASAAKIARSEWIGWQEFAGEVFIWFAGWRFGWTIKTTESSIWFGAVGYLRVNIAEAALLTVASLGGMNCRQVYYLCLC